MAFSIIPSRCEIGYRSSIFTTPSSPVFQLVKIIYRNLIRNEINTGVVCGFLFVSVVIYFAVDAYFADQFCIFLFMVYTKKWRPEPLGHQTPLINPEVTPGIIQDCFETTRF